MTISRVDTLTRLGAETFDLAVIGAGIVGARIAYEAATAGLRVALVDAGDFGGATSSASSKLLHGGLRYFTRGHLRLVRAANLEKRSLTERVAPHLIQRHPVVAMVTSRGISSPMVASAALVAYWGLSNFGRPRPRVISEREARGLAPALLAQPGATYILVEESITNDTRLTLATVATAARHGAVVANYLPVSAIAFSAGAWRLDAEPAEGRLAITARAVVNATGPWVDQVRALERPGRPPLVRLSKGVHAMLPLAGHWPATISPHAPHVRNIFASPWQGLLLLGTTDEPYEGQPGAVTATDAELDALFADAATFLAPEHLRRERLLSHFAGLRALPITGGATSDAPREHVLDVSDRGLVSVAGGKLTTHRPIALDALRHLPAAVRPRVKRPTDARLDDPAPLARYAQLPDAITPVHPDGPDTWAAVYRAVEVEWALTVDDVLRRRTTIALRGHATDAVRQRVRDVLGRYRGT